MTSYIVRFARSSSENIGQTWRLCLREMRHSKIDEKISSRSTEGAKTARRYPE